MEDLHNYDCDPDHPISCKGYDKHIDDHSNYDANHQIDKVVYKPGYGWKMKDR